MKTSMQESSLHFTRRLGGDSESRGFGVFLLVCVIVAIVYLLYLVYKRWRSVRNFQIMTQTNAQVDQVLGDINIERSLSLDDEEEYDATHDQWRNPQQSGRSKPMEISETNESDII